MDRPHRPSIDTHSFSSLCDSTSLRLCVCPLFLCFAAVLLLPACRQQAPNPATASAGGSARPADTRSAIDSRDDLDPWIGKRVTLAGRLGTFKGEHAKITTPGGLVVGLPNFDNIGHGLAWHEHLSRPVEVTGILHAPHPAVPGGIPNFEGPTIEVESFRPVE